MEIGTKITLATDECGEEIVKNILFQDKQDIFWESENQENGDIQNQWKTKYPNYQGGRVFYTYVGKRATSFSEDTVYLCK